MIDIQNPNRVQQKQKKVTSLTHDNDKPQLSRREREEIEKQKAKAHYQKLHAAGKTTNYKPRFLLETILTIYFPNGNSLYTL